MRHSGLKLVLIFALLVIAAAFVFAVKNSGIGVYLDTLGNDKASIVRVAGQPIAAEVVVDADSQAQGLSGRASLQENRGMLFVFERDNYYAIWMKGMLFSIDALWIAEDGVIVDLRENLTPESYPKVFRPEVPARYILELPAGFVAENEVQVGDTVGI